MKEADLVIDTEEIAEFFYMELIKKRVHTCGAGNV